MLTPLPTFKYNNFFLNCNMKIDQQTACDIYVTLAVAFVLTLAMFVIFNADKISAVIGSR